MRKFLFDVENVVRTNTLNEITCFVADSTVLLESLLLIPFLHKSYLTLVDDE